MLSSWIRYKASLHVYTQLLTTYYISAQMFYHKLKRAINRAIERLNLCKVSMDVWRWVSNVRLTAPCNVNMVRLTPCNAVGPLKICIYLLPNIYHRQKLPSTFSPMGNAPWLRCLLHVKTQLSTKHYI